MLDVMYRKSDVAEFLVVGSATEHRKHSIGTETDMAVLISVLCSMRHGTKPEYYTKFYITRGQKSCVAFLRNNNEWKL